MNKLIKLKDDHYVVVNDSEIKEGDYAVGFAEGIKGAGRGWFTFFHDGSSASKFNSLCKNAYKITHSTQPVDKVNGYPGFIVGGVQELSLQEVKELIGEIDVEKTYSRDDLWWAYVRGFQANEEKKKPLKDFKDVINSLKVPSEQIKEVTSWEIELETIDNRQPCDCSCHHNPNMVHFVACCNNGWIGTVTHKLKLK